MRSDSDTLFLRLLFQFQFFLMLLAVAVEREGIEAIVDFSVVHDMPSLLFVSESCHHDIE
jgi:hypothetical protein